MLAATRHCFVGVIFCLTIHLCAVSQSPQEGARLTIFPPSAISAEDVRAWYVLYGPFGAHGGYSDRRRDSAFLEIPLFVEHAPASEIRFFAWSPGCHIETFEIPLRGLDIQESYRCDPIQNVHLTGKLKDPALLRDRNAEIEVDYLANWACGFFDFGDCAVPQISLGTAKIAADGSFAMEVPDFALDPIEPGTGLPSDFQFFLREIKTMNHIASLHPASESLRGPDGGLKPASAYSNRIIFVAERTK